MSESMAVASAPPHVLLAEDAGPMLAVLPAAADIDLLMKLILESHLPELRRFARMLVNQPDIAEDMVQQTCLKAWIGRVAYDATRPARPWLVQILKNEVRQTLRRPQALTNVDDQTFDERWRIEPAVDQTIEILSLWRHLATLPDEQKRAIILVVALGLSYDEAANVSQCLPGTIKSRVNRGKQRLRQAMGINMPITDLKIAS